jgi:nucleosome assembly protein 1-like 1
MLVNQTIKEQIFEKDRSILGYLQNITLDLHEKGYGYELTFWFEKNAYFQETSLKKSFIMSQQNVIERCEGTPITWLPGCDVTMAKKKKGKGNKKKTVTVKCDSFFNFFASRDASQAVEDHGDDSEDDQGELMDQDFELGNEFKDNLVPLALEYYLDVIPQGGEDDDDSEGDHDDHDSDEEPAPKKKSGKKAGGAGASAGAQPQLGPDGKPQECK